MYSVLVPNTIGIGKNLQYFVRTSSIRFFSKNSIESSLIYMTISVPRSILSILVIVYSGDPLLSH